MDMRAYIAQRLDEIPSITQRDMLRDVMEDIFIPLYDHVEGQYNELERRVKDEKALDIGMYSIWTTVMERRKAQGGCPYLFPMLDDDIGKGPVEISDLQHAVTGGTEVLLDTVFLEADYLECKEFAGNGRIYTGKLVAGGSEIAIGVKLRPAKRYLSCVESIYRLFISNIIPWQTINCPYLFKMFDIVLFRMDDTVELSGTVQKVAIDYGNFQAKVREGYVPVWNIEKLHIKSEDFPLATLDKLNYEYQFDLNEFGMEHGYLADYASAEIAAVRRERDFLIVTSPVAKGLVWDMYKVAKKIDYETDFFQYEPMGNAQDDSFAARMISHYGTLIKTKAELSRILNSYGASKQLKLESFQIVPGQSTGETYEVNTFMIDEVRDFTVSKSMLLRFRPLVRNHFLLRDEMSFLTSQVQLIYPEFHCVGVLV